MKSWLPPVHKGLLDITEAGQLYTMKSGTSSTRILTPTHSHGISPP